MTPREVILELARERWNQLSNNETLDFKERIKALLPNDRAFFRLLQVLEGYPNQAPQKKGTRKK